MRGLLIGKEKRLPLASAGAYETMALWRAWISMESGCSLPMQDPYETTASLPGMDKHGKRLFLAGAGAYETMAFWRAWRLGRLRGRRKGGCLK